MLLQQEEWSIFLKQQKYCVDISWQPLFWSPKLQLGWVAILNNLGTFDFLDSQPALIN